MINWLNNKEVDHKLVEVLLKKHSIKENHFTNGGPIVGILEKFLHLIYEINMDRVVIMTNNGSSALHTLVEFYKQNFGAIEWDVPSFTFHTNKQGSLSNSNILDIDECFEINPNNNVVVTNQFGTVRNIDKYLEYSKQNSKFVLFDNAATHYSFYRESNVLNYGDGSSISFHHTKPFGFGEGGAIIIKKEYENEIRRILNFGIDNTFNSNSYSNNYKMSDISAVYILQYLINYFNTIVDTHSYIYEMIKYRIRNIEGVSLLPDNSDFTKTPVLSTIAVIFDKPINIKSNDCVIRKYYKPLMSFPVVDNIYDRTLCFPCHISMTDGDINTIVNIIEKNY